MIGKIVSGSLVFASVIAAVAVGSQLDTAEPTTASGSVISVTPARQDVACPGPLVTPAGGTGSDPELGGAATQVTRKTFLAGAVREVGEGSASDAVVGSAVERVGGGDISGLAALTCGVPDIDQWLIGGATSVGASARLVLANPSQASVEATVTIYGELGELETRVVPIGPDGQAELLLEGVVVDVALLAVHVTATGTGVVAALQDSRLEGFQPAGTEWVVPGAVAQELAIPGVGTQGVSGQTATVRLMAPSGATARLALSTPGGELLWEGVNQLELEAGVVVEVPVPTIDNATATISATQPVMAAAYMTRSRPATVGVAGDTAREARWIAAQAVGDDSESAVVTVGYDAFVAVYAPRRGTFTLTDEDGTEVASVQLTAGSSALVPIKASAGTQLTASGDYVWALLVENNAFISAMTPLRTTVEDLDVSVEQRRYVP